MTPPTPTTPGDARRAGGTRKVGELAAATGLTVRTLHHYEQIGLLVASERSDAGHRRYTESDVERLYRICLLRRLGFPLAEVADALDDPAWSLRAAMASQLRDLDRRLGIIGGLRARVSHLLATTGPTDGPGDTDSRSGLLPSPAADSRSGLLPSPAADSRSGPLPSPAADSRSGPLPSPAADLMTLLEEMTMLDTTMQRRISILVYADLDAAYEHLTRVFGLGPGELTRDPEGVAVHGELQAGDGVVWLHPEAPDFDLVSPRTLGASTATIAVMVDDVDAHHRHVVEEGGTIRYPPVDQPYGYREYSASDSEGHLWSFMKPLD